MVNKISMKQIFLVQNAQQVQWVSTWLTDTSCGIQVFVSAKLTAEVVMERS